MITLLLKHGVPMLMRFVFVLIFWPLLMVFDPTAFRQSYRNGFRGELREIVLFVHKGL